MKTKKWFPFAVFVLVLSLTEAAIFLSARASRHEDPVIVHGVQTPPGADELIDSGAIDSFMIDYLRTTGVPGAILAVVRGNEVLHTAGYGRTSARVQITADTPMPIASLTKSMTATVVMGLVENGTLILDAPVQRFLPEFGLADLRSASITIRHLLNQTSGLAATSLPVKPATVPASLSEELRWLRGANLLSGPGERFQYCNENYHVLAAVVERVTGMPFETYLAEQLFGPLDMSESRDLLNLRDFESSADRGHELVFGVPVPWHVPDEIANGASGVVSTARDLSLWLRFNLGSGATSGRNAAVSRASLAAMHTASAPGSNYGFGWRQDTWSDGTVNVHHSGIARAFTAHMSLFPDSGYGYAFVVNGGHFFRVEAASLRYGLDAIMTGRSANTDWPFRLLGLPLGFVADNVLAILAAIFVAVGIVGCLRARIWVERRIGSSRFAIGLRLSPFAALLLVLAVLPWLLAVFNRGQPVELGRIFSYWPPMAVVYFAACLAALSVLSMRAVFLVSLEGQSVRSRS